MEKKRPGRAKESFGEFWDKRGFSILLCACLTVIGLTAWFTRTAEPEEEVPLPSVTTYATPAPTIKAVAAGGVTIVPSPTPLPLVCPVDEMKAGMVFGGERLVFSDTLGEWRLHPGVDFLGEEGSLVRAMLGGTVKAVTTDPYLGVCVEMDHGGGLTSLYACLYEEVLVAKGDAVSAGQAIALMGNSGYTESAAGIHVHVELRRNGKPQELRFE